MKKQESTPKLRFPEFSEEWKLIKIIDSYELISGQHLNPDEYTLKTDTHIPYFTGPSDFTNEPEKVTKGALTEGKRATCGDILFTVKGSGVGTMMYLLLPQVVMGRQLMGIKSNSGSTSFLYHNLGTCKVFFERLATGNMIPGLTRADILNTQLFSPGLKEQKKLALFLTVIDEKITQLKKKKNLLEQYKKGVMQQLFSKELRFKYEIENNDVECGKVLLGSLCKITTGKLDANAMIENGKFRFYTCAKDYYKINDYAFDTEALLISGNGANVGYIHYYKGKFNAYQRTYVMDGFEQNIHYVKYYLEHFLPSRIFNEKKEGNTPYIVLSTLSEMPILIPSFPEQTKIASFLSALDTKISLTAHQIVKMQTWKKGLLQQMFC